MRPAYASCLGLLLAAASLQACATRDAFVTASIADSSGSWRIERGSDRITGAPFSSASVASSKASTSAIPNVPSVLLQLACFKQQPLVRLSFLFEVGSAKNIEFGYRFDDKPGHEVEVRSVTGEKTLVIDDKLAVAQFVNELTAAKALYVQIRSLNRGRTTAEFQVEGAQAAIDSAFAGCPIAGHPKHVAGSS